MNGGMWCLAKPIKRLRKRTILVRNHIHAFRLDTELGADTVTEILAIIVAMVQFHAMGYKVHIKHGTVHRI